MAIVREVATLQMKASILEAWSLKVIILGLYKDYVIDISLVTWNESKMKSGVLKVSTQARLNMTY